MAEPLGAFGETPFSARLRIWLVYNNHKIKLSHSGPNWIIAVKPKKLPACYARVVISIDGKDHPHDVHLVNGMSKQDQKTPVELAQIAPF